MGPENKIFYTFVYAYKFAVERDEPAHTYTLMLEGEGVPYRIDGWNGEVRKIEPYKIENGHTVLSVTLKSGEEALIALDLESQSELHAVEANTEIRAGGGLKFRAEHSGCCQAVLSDGWHVAEEVLVPEEMPLEKWNIEIEDWNEGDRKVNIEEKFRAYNTRSILYDAQDSPEIRRLPVGAVEEPAGRKRAACAVGRRASRHGSGLRTWTL